MKAVQDARGAGATLALDGGDALFKESPVPPPLRPQYREKARVIAQAYGQVLDAFVPGVLDMAEGGAFMRDLLSQHRVPVLAANLVDAGGKPAYPARLFKQVGNVRVLLVGAVDPGVWPADPDLKATPPGQALQAALKDAPEHDVAILVTSAPIEAAMAMAAQVPHFGLVTAGNTGQLFFLPRAIKLPAGAPIANAIAFASSRGGKYLAALTVTLRTANRGVGGGEDYAKAHNRLRSVEAAVKRGTATPELKAQMAPLQALVAKVEAGNHGVLDLRPLDQSLPRDPAVAAAVQAYLDANAAREAALLKVTTPLVDMPASSPFTGSAKCTSCHAAAQEVWLHTRHANAMASLRKTNQQLDRECIGCHSTGWRKPGGFSEPGRVGGLAEVQCEACHGPGRDHVATGGDVRKVARGTGEALCRTCHTPEATPQFRFERDRNLIRHWKAP